MAHRPECAICPDLAPRSHTSRTRFEQDARSASAGSKQRAYDGQPVVCRHPHSRHVLPSLPNISQLQADHTRRCRVESARSRIARSDLLAKWEWHRKTVSFCFSFRLPRLEAIWIVASCVHRASKPPELRRHPANKPCAKNPVRLRTVWRAPMPHRPTTLHAAKPQRKATPQNAKPSKRHSHSNPVAALVRHAPALSYTSRAMRSSYVSRCVVTRASPSFTNTTAGRGWPL